MNESLLNALAAILATGYAGEYDRVIKAAATLNPACKHSAEEQLLEAMVHVAQKRPEFSVFKTMVTEELMGQTDAIHMLGNVMPRAVTQWYLDHYLSAAIDDHKKAMRAELDRKTLETIKAGGKPDYHSIARALTELDGLAARLPWLTAAELCELQCDTRWTVASYLPAGSLTIFSGIGGAGKSMLSSHVALCVARGTDFFGCTVERGRVAYLDFENTAEQAAGRFRAVGLRTDDDVVVLTPDTLGRRINILEHEGLTTLRNAIAQIRPGLLIVDTLRRITNGDMNEAGMVDAMLSRLMDAAGGAAVLGLAHWRKSSLASNDAGERLLGSVDLRNFCRSHLVLTTERVGENSTSRLEIEKGNFLVAPVPPLAITWKKDASGMLTFNATPDDGPKATWQQRIVRQIICAAGDAGATRLEIVREAGKKGIKERATDTVLGDLYAAHDVTNEPVKRNGKSYALYRLAVR